MRVFRFLVLLLAALAGGCVVSKSPLAGLGERVSPFASGTRFNIFERVDAKGPWNPGEEKSVTLVAGADRVYRSVNEAGKTEDDGFSFHPLAPNRFLVAAQFSSARFAYGMLEIRNGEGFAVPFQCKSIGPATLQRAGLKLIADDCWLEDTTDPVAFLKQLAERPLVPLVKYVPVKKK
jgi:hypothetical protein